MIRTKAERTVMIIGVALILLVLSLFIPTIREGRRILSPDDRKEVVYSGVSEDTGNNGSSDTTNVEER